MVMAMGWAMVGTDLAWWDWRWKAVDGGERWQMVEFGGG